MRKKQLTQHNIKCIILAPATMAKPAKGKKIKTDKRDAAHINWLHSLKPDRIYKEILEEYLLTFDVLTDKPERLDRRIEELASDKEYKENAGKLSCFLRIKTQTALSVIVEVGDFKRFSSAQHFASYIGLVPGEDSGGGDQNRLCITKAGNRQVRLLLVEAAQSFSRGQTGYKSKAPKERQSGNCKPRN